MYWRITFKDQVDEIYLGCCNVRAQSQIKALKKVNALRINPGGTAFVASVGNEPDLGPNRLYSQQELIDMGYKFWKY